MTPAKTPDCTEILIRSSQELGNTHLDIHPQLLVIVPLSKVFLPPPNQVPIPVITASVLTVALCPEVHSAAACSHTL